MNNKTLGILIVLLIASLFASYMGFEYYKKILDADVKPISPIVSDTPKLIGGDIDTHGCLPAAGYTYDEDVMLCVRPWLLDSAKKEAVKTVVDSLRADINLPTSGVYLERVELLRCPGCANVYINTKEEELEGKIMLIKMQNGVVAEPEYVDFNEIPEEPISVAPIPTPDTSTGYVCPAQEYVDCMPTIGAGDRTQCSTEYLSWAQANCPNFKGAAY